MTNTLECARCKIGFGDASHPTLELVGDEILCEDCVLNEVERIKRRFVVPKWKKITLAIAWILAYIVGVGIGSVLFLRWFVK
jgi:hypothetical protein